MKSTHESLEKSIRVLCNGIGTTDQELSKKLLSLLNKVSYRPDFMRGKASYAQKYETMLMLLGTTRPNKYIELKSALTEMVWLRAEITSVANFSQLAKIRKIMTGGVDEKLLGKHKGSVHETIARPAFDFLRANCIHYSVEFQKYFYPDRFRIRIAGELDLPPGPGVDFELDKTELEKVLSVEAKIEIREHLLVLFVHNHASSRYQLPCIAFVDAFCRKEGYSVYTEEEIRQEIQKHLPLLPLVEIVMSYALER